jgi:ATP-binding cassette subfamily F protein 3
MAYASGEGLSKYYGADPVFENVSFRLDAGDRVGLIGPNGAGKSTLLRVIADVDSPTVGEIRRKKGLQVGYLSQNPQLDEGRTLWETVSSAFDDIARLEDRLAEISSLMATGGESEALMKQYDAVQDRLNSRGAHRTAPRIESVLAGLGFEPDQHQTPIEQFSGGQRSRAALARLMLEDHEFLFLDEPTNHLDMECVEWLQQRLRGYEGGIVIVSHDRFLLDALVETIWEIGFRTLETYPGNYTRYLPQRKERYTHRTRQYEADQEYIERTERYIRKYHAGQRGKEARGRRKKLDRFLKEGPSEKPQDHRTIHIRLRPRSRGGELVADAEGLTVGYDPGNPILTVPDFRINRGERIAIVGPNGSGKTTLLRTLFKDLASLSGSVRLGAGVDVGYLGQHSGDLLDERRALDEVLDANPRILPEDVRNLLGSLLIKDDDAMRPTRELSGGQRSRVCLARLAVQDANLLLLDEPTNHLDIPSREILQEALKEFEGTVIFVSHDRYLVDALADRLWVLEPSGIRMTEGNWSDYVRRRANVESGKGDAPSSDDSETQNRKQRYQEERKQRRQVERAAARQQALENRIEELELQLKEFELLIDQAGEAQDVERVSELGLRHREVSDELKACWDEWTELSERLENQVST